jgi:glycosyltransferase involved in cell wall biosynthesis
MSLTPSTPQAPTVSAVICTRNRADLIGNAVTSVLANTYPNFELLVIDQSTDQRTGQIVNGLMSTHANLRYLHTEKAGLSRAYNIGIRETTGDLLAFTDDDCVAPPDWIASIVSVFDRESDVEMLYGQVLLPYRLAARQDDVPTLPIDEPWRLARRVRGFERYGMGANFAARRGLFKRIGLFDEVLGGGGLLKSSQDFDIQYRAYVGDAIISYRPDVSVDHYGLRTPEQWPTTHHAYGVGDGAFFLKHVRCGDFYALRLLVGYLGRILFREALHVTGVRRRYSRAPYIRAFFTGLVESMRFGVDRQRRMYVNA